MKLTRESFETGKMNTMELPISEQQYNAWRNGEENIWLALPVLTSEQVHFVLTGITVEENAQMELEVREEIETEDLLELSTQAYA